MTLFSQLRDAAQVALNQVQNEEKRLHDLHAKSVDLSAQLDEAGAVLATAKAARALHPEQPHLTAAVTLATGKFESLEDAAELNLRSIESASKACVDAQSALTAAEIALKPALEAHLAEMQQLWTTKRAVYDSVMPSARKLIVAFGDSAPQALAAIMKANGNPMPAQAPPEPTTPIQTWIASKAQLPDPVSAASPASRKENDHS